MRAAFCSCIEFPDTVRPSACVACTGETAGLRIPVAGWDGGGRPHWVLGGRVLFSGHPTAVGIGSEAADAANEPAGVLNGADARSRLGSLAPPPRTAERPHPSSQAGVDAPPVTAGVRWLIATQCQGSRVRVGRGVAVLIVETGGSKDRLRAGQGDTLSALHMLGRGCDSHSALAVVTDDLCMRAEAVWLAGATRYTNRYRNGWAAAAAVARQALDEAKRPGRKQRSASAIPYADMPQPVLVSRFQWPQPQVSGPLNLEIVPLLCWRC